VRDESSRGDAKTLHPFTADCTSKSSRGAARCSRVLHEHLADAIELLLATRPRVTVEEKVSTLECYLAMAMLTRTDIRAVSWLA
jgi:hypothetical protein